MARQEGSITRALTTGWLIFLGEASFSIYLLHQTILRGWPVRVGTVVSQPIWLSYGLFWVILIVLAAAVHMLVERPARRLIIRYFRGLQLAP